MTKAITKLESVLDAFYIMYTYYVFTNTSLVNNSIMCYNGVSSIISYKGKNYDDSNN